MQVHRPVHGLRSHWFDSTESRFDYQRVLANLGVTRWRSRRDLSSSSKTVAVKRGRIARRQRLKRVLQDFRTVVDAKIILLEASKRSGWETLVKSGYN